MNRLAGRVAALAAALVLVGCAAPRNQAPVEDRSARPTPQTQGPTVLALPPAAKPNEAVKPPPAGAENAGKPGFYTVKPGDTLIRVGLDNGQSWRDIARWNNLDNPNLIEVGQVLRVLPPGVDPGAPATRPVAASAGRVEARPVEGRAAASAAAAASASGATPAASPAVGLASASSAASAASAAAPAAAIREGDDDVPWQWPAAGAVTTPFDESRNHKGIGIAGKTGEPVLAAADGRVVYAGSGLRGYGNLVIVMHNKTYLTAYAHNQTLLVKEDQAVRRGQKIAEMGSSDSDRVQLHFEIRRQGKPVDPVRLLPPR
jgi:lipoprotein NlpD